MTVGIPILPTPIAMTETQYFLGFIPYSSAITVRAVAVTALASISFGAYSLHSMSSPVSLFGSSRLSMARATSAMGDILGSGAILGLHSAKQIAVVGFNADQTSAPGSCYAAGLDGCIAPWSNGANGYTEDRGIASRIGNRSAVALARGENSASYAAGGNYAARRGVSGPGMAGGGYGSSAGSMDSRSADSRGSRSSNGGSIGQASAIGVASALSSASANGSMAPSAHENSVASTHASESAQLNASESAAFNRATSECGSLAPCESAGVLDGENTASTHNAPNTRHSEVADVRSNHPANVSNSHPGDLDGFQGSPLVPDAPIVPFKPVLSTPPTTVDFGPEGETRNSDNILRLASVDCDSAPTIPACTGALIAAEIAVVPEPATIVLLSAGLLGLLVAHRRRSATNS